MMSKIGMLLSFMFITICIVSILSLDIWKKIYDKIISDFSTLLKLN